MTNLPRKVCESGQAVLLVLLAMSVVLTVGLSVVSRTITDVTVTTTDEESTRAFAAAEAGIERALITGSNTGSISLGSSAFNATVLSAGVSSNSFNHPQPIRSGESIPLWLVGHNSNGDVVCNATYPCFTGNILRVCWGQPGTSRTSITVPAIEASIFYDPTPSSPPSYADVRVAKAAVDPYNGTNTSRSGNAFDKSINVNCTISGKSYAFYKDLSLTSMGIPAISQNSNYGLFLAKFRLLYNDTQHEVGITTAGVTGFSGTNFPTQGVDVESTGTAGSANRKIKVFQSFSEPPPIFDAVIYTENSGGITK